MIRIVALLALTTASSVIALPTSRASSELLALSAFASASVDSAQNTPTPIPPTIAAPNEPEARTISIEDEVLGNLKSQPIGPATLDDLALPEEFLKRVGDRVIRASFEERYRIVVPDPKPEDAKPAADAKATAPPKVEHPSSSSPMGLGLPVGTAIFAAFVAILVATRRRRAGGNA